MARMWLYQPFKGILTIILLAGSPIYFCVLAIYYIPKQLRPHPKWSLHTSLGCAFYHVLFRFTEMVRLAPYYATRTGSPKDRFVMVKPRPIAHYTGPLQHPTIKPVPFGALWFPNAPSEADIQSRTFVLHFPGGAFVIATPPLSTGEYPSSVYAKRLNALTFYAQYRVADTPQTRFPAALQDAVTFYTYLLDLGIPAKNIIISGDSAGGNLVIALMRYIEANKGLLPKPQGIISWSPWLDVTPSAVEQYRRSAKARTDLAPWQILQWGLKSYPPPPSESSKEVQAYISPAQHPFSTSIPLLLQVGTCEVFHEHVKSFGDAMAGVEGNIVKYHETPNAPHDLILCGKLLGMGKETEDVVDSAHEFFDI